jgi:hypothetical protein
MPIEHTLPRSSVAGNGAHDWDPFNYLSELGWNRATTDVGVLFGNRKTDEEELQSGQRSSDIGLEQIGQPPSDVLKHLSDLLVQDPVSTSARAPRPQVNMRVDHVWEGVVTKVGSSIFEAKFVPLGEVAPVMLGDFLISEVVDDDLELVRPNALFYVISGRIQVSKSISQPTSAIRFRRLPQITKQRVEQALDRARQRLSESSR